MANKLKTIEEDFPTLDEIKEDINETQTPDKNKVRAKDINEIRSALKLLLNEQKEKLLFAGSPASLDEIELNEEINNFTFLVIVINTGIGVFHSTTTTSTALLNKKISISYSDGFTSLEYINEKILKIVYSSSIEPFESIEIYGVL